MGEENNQNKGIDKLLLAALTAQMFALMDQKLEDYRAEVAHSNVRDQEEVQTNLPQRAIIVVPTDTVAQEEGGTIRKQRHKPMILLVV